MSARRPWAWPLVPVYRAALAVKDALRGQAKRLQWPVVSVGSLSAGGAGKTPVVIALALLLKERGWTVDVLSRGYGRAGSGVEMVAATVEKQILRSAQDDNSSSDAAQFGDEPVVMAGWVRNGSRRDRRRKKSKDERKVRNGKTQWAQWKSARSCAACICWMMAFSTGNWSGRWMWCS